MGVAITELLVKNEIELKDLTNKVIVVDAPLFLYQFLSTIRGPDGTPLTDSKGNVTSHLTGLFFRTASLMQNGIKLAYVFDGTAPKLKAKERERRKELKEAAQVEYEIAKEREDVEAMKKFAMRTSRLDSKMIEESKELIIGFGLPVINAPSEGEAQASHIVKSGNAYAIATQDADTMMFGAPRLIRNLSIAGKRKKANKLAFDVYKPEIITLTDTLNSLQINNEQLIAMCMLIGTDFNIGGIKGIGPKKSLGLIKKFGFDFEGLFNEVKWSEHFDYSWNEVFDTIKNMPVSDDYKLEWKKVDENKIREILVERHEFSLERINNTLDKLKKESNKQRGLGEFF
jgi:flap endonuclease-1